MLKRKRTPSSDDDSLSESEDNNNPTIEQPRPTLRATRAESKLQNGVKGVQRALKLAAGFERQKIGRRRKTAAEKKDTVAQARLDKEYEGLKSLNLHDVAQNHLCKTLLKIKKVESLRASDSLPKSLSSLPPKTGISFDTSLLNVLARLYKADAVQKAVSSAVEDMLSALGLGDTRNSKSTKSIQIAASGEGSEDEEEDSWSGIADSDEESDTGVVLRTSGGLSLSPEPSSVKKSITKSAFLPALSVGYLPGSGSEPEDNDFDVAPKKNRRGQRARQQIWEKKFGKKAKHLENQPKEDRNQGWDPKRGAQVPGGDRGRRGGRQGFGAIRETRGRTDKTGANAVPMAKPKKRDDQGTVHPSWEAAKKAKERPQTAQFTGKKISFD